jgi:ADP-heptose:LPS heptosyltransferase
MNINWKNVKRVLVVRLRSIGDTVLATPSLIALKRFLPDAQVDILLEDWVAPVLEKRLKVAAASGESNSSQQIRCRIQSARRNNRNIFRPRERRKTSCRL